jgi:hypothetical protein
MKNQNKFGNTNKNITSLNNNHNIRSMHTSIKTPISYNINKKNNTKYNVHYKLDYDQKVFLKKVLTLPTEELGTMGITQNLVQCIVQIIHREQYRDYDLDLLNNLRKQYILREKLKRDLNILFTVTLGI